MQKTNFEKLDVYILSEKLSDNIWEIVLRWKYLPLHTVGKQLITAADSIGANIAEGTGRGSLAENRRFAKIARGSLFEVKHWLKRSSSRELLTKDELEILVKFVDELAPRLSAYINSISKRLNSPSKS
jgi:four helix bundle protein